jgi:hypothetical protein
MTLASAASKDDLIFWRDCWRVGLDSMECSSQKG